MTVTKNPLGTVCAVVRREASSRSRSVTASVLSLTSTRISRSTMIRGSVMRAANWAVRRVDVLFNPACTGRRSAAGSSQRAEPAADAANRVADRPPKVRRSAGWGYAGVGIAGAPGVLAVRLTTARPRYLPPRARHRATVSTGIAGRVSAGRLTFGRGRRRRCELLPRRRGCCPRRSPPR
jgi:hypothetical protein